MPTLSRHQSNDFTKMLLLGDSGSGKTGSLASLVAAGYKLRILDYDNGLESLKQQVLHICPEKIDQVEYRTLQDRRQSSPFGSVLSGQPNAFRRGIELTDRWKYKDDNGDEVDLGVPEEWGKDTILCLDSFTLMCDAAYDHAEPLVMKGKGGEKDGRAIYGMAQDMAEAYLKTICSEYFRCNVIAIAHVRYIDTPDGIRKGFPATIGQALSPKVPVLFNSMAMCRTVAGKRTIQTEATALIDLKNPKPFEMKPSFPLSTGLAEFFGTLRPNPTKETTHPEPLPQTTETVRRFNRR